MDNKKILDDAAKKIPFLDNAYGIVGICAAISMIVGLGVSKDISFPFETVAGFMVLMLALFIVSRIPGHEKLVTAIIYFVTGVAMFFCCMIMTSIFFDCPLEKEEALELMGTKKDCHYIKVLSNVRDGGAAPGAFFSFDSKQMDDYLNKPWYSVKLKVRKSIESTGAEKLAIFWNDPVGGALDGDAHGRYDPTEKPGDWKVNDKICIVNNEDNKRLKGEISIAEED